MGSGSGRGHIYMNIGLAQEVMPLVEAVNGLVAQPLQIVHEP